MATVIKLNRNVTAGNAPSTYDLIVGEVALNTADKELYVRDSSNAIVKFANYSEKDIALEFPTGDYGSVASTLTTDAFGELLDVIYDLQTNIKYRLATEDLGSVV